MKSKIPNKNPFENQWRFWTKQYWISFFRPIDPKQWHNPINQMLEHYKTILKIKNDSKYLKKGTLLFHGTTNKILKLNDKNSISFFGLDIVISLWYILEEIYNKNDLKKNKFASVNGYIYEFELIKDLPISKILNILNINPKDSISGCENDIKTVCLHPQIAFHGSSVQTAMRTIIPKFDLCSEITFVYKEYKDYLKLNKIYIVDPLILHKNANKISFDPVESIVNEEKYPNYISRKEYLELFYSKPFTKQEFVTLFL